MLPTFHSFVHLLACGSFLLASIETSGQAEEREGIFLAPLTLDFPSKHTHTTVSECTKKEPDCGESKGEATETHFCIMLNHVYDMYNRRSGTVKGGKELRKVVALSGAYR